MRLIRILVLLLLPATALASDPLSGVFPSTAPNPGSSKFVWMTDSLQKIRQDLVSGTTTNQGLVIYGTQNEFVDFQVQVQAPNGGIPNLTVALSSLTSTQNSFVIGSTATDIIVYREIYINVSTPSSIGAMYYASSGSYPDALMPTVDPYWNQQTLAYPILVTTNQVQGSWIDVHIPTNTPSAVYSGSIYVSSGNVVIATMTVVIPVWQWANGGYMPSTATYRTVLSPEFANLCALAYGSTGANREAGCKAYTNAGADDLGATLVLADSAGFLLDHRISGTYLYEPADSPSSSSLPTYWGPWLNGTAGRFKAMLPGAQLNTFNYSPGTFGSSSAGTWVTYFNSNGLNTNSMLPYDKSCDESSCTPSQFITKAQTMHSANPPMPEAWTTDLAYNTGTNATNYLDIQIVLNFNLDQNPGGLQTSNYSTWLASAPTNCGPSSNLSCPSHQLWHYDDCVSEGGNCANGTVGGSTGYWANKHVDGKAVANRAEPWIAFNRDSAIGELYFDPTYCWTHACNNTPVNTYVNNPFTSVYYSGGQGDGTIIYPGTSSGSFHTNGYVVTFAVSTSTPIYLPSIRLNQWRDGIQDYEYMVALKNAGKQSIVNTAAATWLTTSSSFNTDPVNNGSFTGTIVSARNTIGTTMHELTYPIASGTFVCLPGTICWQ